MTDLGPVLAFMLTVICVAAFLGGIAFAALLWWLI